MTSLLTFETVSAGYGPTDILKAVSFSVAPGEAWVVLGPNGAGKSTLIRAGMGMLKHRAGRIQVCGLTLPTPGPVELARRVAWVPQNTDQTPSFSVLELTLMGRAPHLPSWGFPGRRETQLAKEALAEVGVAHLTERPLHELSGGERRRVWLARAFVQTPRLLFLDEPTAFLDVRHQVETLLAVKKRVRDGLGVVAVLHDVNLTAHIATHVLLLKCGSVVAQGPVSEILTPQNLTTLFDIPMHAAAEQEHVYVPSWPAA
jgi:iron complex transport system ATP-binding protein